MEGVKRNQVCLMPHQRAWDEEFERVRKQILEIWGENVLDIQHVGSTAIPSIWAKPILDVAVRLCSIDRMNKDKLEELGYDYRGPSMEKKPIIFLCCGERGSCHCITSTATTKAMGSFFSWWGFGIIFAPMRKRPQNMKN